MIRKNAQRRRENYDVRRSENHDVNPDLMKVAEEWFNLVYRFIGKGMDEKLIRKNDSKNPLVIVSKEFFRPTDVVHLQCDSRKIQHELGWKQEKNLDDILEMMLR